jgi:hypothetical protein
MSRPVAPGSFDCVAARFATGTFAQDDDSQEGEKVTRSQHDNS